MINEGKILYTYKHRKIIMFLAKKFNLGDDILKQLELHDLDKMFLYLIYDKDSVKQSHRLISHHHDNDIPKNKEDYIEMILDWESARYSKDDKPLNAYDTLVNYYQNLEEEVMPILKELNIAKSTLEKDADVVEYAKSLENTTIDDVKKELIGFIENL